MQAAAPRWRVFESEGGCIKSMGREKHLRAARRAGKGAQQQAPLTPSKAEPVTTSPAPSRWPCPGFDLGALTRLNPEIFDLGMVNPADKFILSLALAHNDLKDLEWMHERLELCQPPNQDAIDGRVGQWLGMRLHVARWTLGVGHEVLKTIGSAYHHGHEAEAKPVLKHPRIRRAIEAMSPQSRETWEKLVEVGKGHHTSQRLREYLSRTRNRAAFHYNYGDELMEGYQRAFRLPRTDRTQFAYLSVDKKSISLTRFHFADAAVQQVYAASDDLDQLFREAIDLLRLMSRGIIIMVVMYIGERQREISERKVQKALAEGEP